MSVRGCSVQSCSGLSVPTVSTLVTRKNDLAPVRSRSLLNQSIYQDYMYNNDDHVDDACAKQNIAITGCFFCWWPLVYLKLHTLPTKSGDYGSKTKSKKPLNDINNKKERVGFSRLLLTNSLRATHN